MELTELHGHLKAGEGISREFKRCGSTPGSDVFETVCSFANRQGGNLFLGVSSSGELAGIDKGRALEVERNIANVTSNPALFDPSPLIEFEEIEIADGSVVIRVWVSPGPFVYRYKGCVYDRVADVDSRVKSVDAISRMYMRKQNSYSERKVFRFVTMDDIRPDLVERARQMAAARTPGHPWSALSDEELLRSAKLRIRDRETGEEGLTLAAVLLLGTDECISDVCPAYKTDCILRAADGDRYDDRLVVSTNILESFDLIASFARRHLPDRFALDGDRRVSARDVIVRELVSNMLIHREYLSPFPAKLVITPGELLTENASRALFEGRLSLSSFNPIPKNPAIASFFSNIGLAEELGSGVRNLEKYAMLYSGKVPTLCDGDVFRASVPIAASFAGGPLALASSLADRDGLVTSESYAEAAGVTARTAQRHLRKLREDGLIAPHPDRPRAYVVAGR